MTVLHFDTLLPFRKVHFLIRTSSTYFPPQSSAIHKNIVQRFDKIHTKRSRNSPKGCRKASQCLPKGLLNLRAPDRFSVSKPRGAPRMPKGTKRDQKGCRGSLFDGFCFIAKTKLKNKHCDHTFQQTHHTLRGGGPTHVRGEVSLPLGVGGAEERKEEGKKRS